MDSVNEYRPLPVDSGNPMAVIESFFDTRSLRSSQDLLWELFSAALCNNADEHFIGRAGGRLGPALPSTGCADAGGLGAERSEGYQSRNALRQGMKERGRYGDDTPGSRHASPQAATGHYR